MHAHIYDVVDSKITVQTVYLAWLDRRYAVCSRRSDGLDRIAVAPGRVTVARRAYVSPAPCVSLGLTHKKCSWEHVIDANHILLLSSSSSQTHSLLLFFSFLSLDIRPAAMIT